MLRKELLAALFAAEPACVDIHVGDEQLLAWLDFLGCDQRQHVVVVVVERVDHDAVGPAGVVDLGQHVEHAQAPCLDGLVGWLQRVDAQAVGCHGVQHLLDLLGRQARQARQANVLHRRQANQHDQVGLVLSIPGAQHRVTAVVLFQQLRQACWAAWLIRMNRMNRLGWLVRLGWFGSLVLQAEHELEHQLPVARSSQPRLFDCNPS